MCLGDPYGVQILLVHCFIEVFPGKSAWRPAQLSPAPLGANVKSSIGPLAGRKLFCQHDTPLLRDVLSWKYLLEPKRLGG
jgi:hypothetical protein